MTTRLTAPTATHAGVRAPAGPSRGRNRCAALVFACALLLVAPAGASAKAFLELPGVPGNSQVAGFEQQIELESFDLGVSNPVQMGSVKVKGKPTFSELGVTKRLDKASPELLLRTANMEAFPSARVRVTTSSSKGESTVARYCFTNVQVTSFKQSSGGDIPSEHVTLSYGTIVLSYTDPASGKGGVFTSGWDVIGGLQFGGACDN